MNEDDDRSQYRHLAESHQIVEAWDSGNPLLAICGFERVVSRETFEESKQLPACPFCMRLAEREGAEVIERTVEEVEKKASQERAILLQRTFGTKSYWYTLQQSTNTPTSWPDGDAPLGNMPST